MPTSQSYKNAELTSGQDARPTTAEEQKQTRLKELINSRKTRIYRGLIERGLSHYILWL